MKKHYDVVIIGSGIGGLVSAVILGSEGYRVCVLEKNNQYGGNLQTFVRDKSIFDTGVHYIGGLDKGQNLYQYFNYLGIMKDLKLKKLDSAFDKVTFDDGEKEYAHYQEYKTFKEQLLNDFPEEEQAIKKYLDKIHETCNNFPLYKVESRPNHIIDMELLSLNTKDFLDSITGNERLKSVLVGTNLIYAGDERTPFFIHALAVNTYLESAYRCEKGGDQITKLLLKRIKETNGEFYRYQKVIEIKTSNKKVRAVKIQNGHVISGDIVISNIEPKLTLDMITGSTIRKSYVNRIKNSESTISVFSVYIVFKPETFEYFNHNVYHFKDHKDAFTAQNYTEENWPLNYMISLKPKKKSNEWADNMTVLMYMNYDDVKQWENTFNTQVEENERGDDYMKFKEKHTEIVLKALEKKYPNIRESIQSVHSSTPLSYRDYIGGNRGCLYGNVKDSAQPLKSFISSKTKIEGLYFTGQSIKMHGILGVTINAVGTCAEIVGKEYLINKVNEANN